MFIWLCVLSLAPVTGFQHQAQHAKPSTSLLEIEAWQAETQHRQFSRAMSMKDSSPQERPVDFHAEADVSLTAMGATARAEANRSLSLLRLTGSSGDDVKVADMWSAASCSQPCPAQAVDQNWVVDVAMSHDAAKQEMCYGHSAGGTLEHPEAPTAILGLDRPAGKMIRSLQCNEEKGRLYRLRNNITVNATKQDLKKRLFKEVVASMHKMGAPLVMTSGVLLGWWRECDFLGHDQDLDFAILHRFLPKDFLQRLDKDGFYVSVRVPTNVQFAEVYDNVGLEVTLKRKEDVHTLALADQPWCDLLIWEEMPMKASEPGLLRVSQPLWFLGNNGTFWNCEQKFESLALATWHGMELYVPYPPEMHLVNKYGNDWDTSKPGGWCIYCDCDKDMSHVVGRRPWMKQWNIVDEDVMVHVTKTFQKRAEEREQGPFRRALSRARGWLKGGSLLR